MKISSLPKIQKFDFTEVIVPAHPGSISGKEINKPLHMLPVKGKSGWSVQFDELKKLILKMTLSDGTVSLSEFYRDHDLEVITEVSKSLLGVSLSELCLTKLPIGLYREYDGFELAIWDAYAKLKNMRLVDLLGGQLQEKAKIGAWSSHRNAEESGKIAAHYAELGYDCIKFKCDLEDDVIQWCEQIAKKAPGMKVILDPNQRWENYGEAKQIIRGLEQVGNVFCLEDPIPRWMLDEYRDMRNFTSIRIVLHNALPYISAGQRLHDLIRITQQRACDGFNFNSGLTAFRKQDAIANASNLYSWHGSEIDFGILEAMYLHQIMATENCIWPSDVFSRNIRSHDLLTEPIRFEPPYAFLPEGPGLGVHLDEHALKKYSVNQFTVQ